MKVCVLGLWHLGTVTAACLAGGGHDVTGLDFDEATITTLRSGKAPVFEPGLDELLSKGLREKRLELTNNIAVAVQEARVVWVTYDTPVDDHDRADVEFVVERVRRVLPALAAGTLVLVSSQLPVGTTRRLEQIGAGKSIRFGCLPENLRLGKAIAAFTQPDRVVAGLRDPADRGTVVELLRPFTEKIEWVAVESAEMTKHALNAFLATSVAFINEIAELCEEVGADAREVERALKSDARIGPRAYLGPGAAFAGGTLARDIVFLSEIGAQMRRPTLLLSAVYASNAAHKEWPRRKLAALPGGLSGRIVAVWGLTYKPGTDTLRRSSAVELCEWLAQQGARVRAHDPAIKKLSGRLAEIVELHASPVAAAEGADALVVATEWPEYRNVPVDAICAAMRAPMVLDPNRFLTGTLGADRRVRYVTVGKA